MCRVAALCFPAGSPSPSVPERVPGARACVGLDGSQGGRKSCRPSLPELSVLPMHLFVQQTAVKHLLCAGHGGWKGVPGACLFSPSGEEKIDILFFCAC